MPRIQYIEKQFRQPALDLIEIANGIIHEYAQQGFSLTLRQLYYQMVARDIIPNSQKEYKRLGNIIANARVAGLVDWFAIEDRTRGLQGNSHWDSPSQIMKGVVTQYKIDKWATQSHRVEVWIEKDALTGVIGGICNEFDIDYFSCRGYTSASEMWKAGRRLARYIKDGQDPLVLHLGDHDPSGMDMTRDIQERLNLFAERFVLIDRIALNMDQINHYNPPPNPTKLSDSRANGYIGDYGRDSWELDALEPRVMVDLIRDKVYEVRDVDLWQEEIEKEEQHRAVLQKAMDDMEEE